MARFDDWVTDPAITRRGSGALRARTRRASASRSSAATRSSRVPGTTGVPGLIVQDADALARLRRAGRDAHGRALAGVELARGSPGAPLRPRCRHRGPLRRGRRLGAPARPAPVVRGQCARRSRDRAHARDLRRAGTLPADGDRLLRDGAPGAGAARRMPGASRSRLRCCGTAASGFHPCRATTSSAPSAAAWQATTGRSEFLSIAFECERGALHVNDDWVVLEPVDEHCRPVPPDTPRHRCCSPTWPTACSRWCATNWATASRSYRSPAPAGSPFPVIRVDGRRDEILRLHDERGREVPVLPMAHLHGGGGGLGRAPLPGGAGGPRALRVRVEQRGRDGANACGCARRRFSPTRDSPASPRA